MFTGLCINTNDSISFTSDWIIKKFSYDQGRNHAFQIVGVRPFGRVTYERCASKWSCDGERKFISSARSREADE